MPWRHRIPLADEPGGDKSAKGDGREVSEEQQEGADTEALDLLSKGVIVQLRRVPIATSPSRCDHQRAKSGRRFQRARGL